MECVVSQMFTVAAPCFPWSCDIQVGSEIVDQIGQYPGQVFVILSDQIVASHYLSAVTQYLTAAGKRSHCIVIPSGERHKNLATLSRIWAQLASYDIDRSVCLVALGGGVVTDITGLAAATFLRGVPYINIATTLLAQVDAAIGGKTAINTSGGRKNCLGTFWLPQYVICDSQLLTTLPQRQYVSGLAEIVKCGVCSNAAFFYWLEQHLDDLVARRSDVLKYAICTAIQCKLATIGDDFFDTQGQRVRLNFGHTFAHAIEETCGYRTVTHGEAVAVGMVLAVHLSYTTQRLPEATYRRVMALVRRVALFCRPSIDLELVCKALYHDKKKKNGSLCFVLLEDIGHTTLCCDIAMPVVRSILQDYVSQRITPC